jgi:2-polyprenyl-6-methoxyphenol hydroxylase-like FAD-dependent oxidoreductase
MEISQNNELRNKNILISGAGAAGQCLAYWLRRYGFRPTVVERAPAPRIGGFAIDLRGAALVVAERMGIIDACRKARVHMQTIARLDPHGKVVWKTDGNFGAGTVASNDIEILRDDLTAILQGAIDDDVEYIFGDSITAIDQQDDGVDVSFKSGGKRRFDLVIGADGLHSNVRELVFGPESQFAKPLEMYIGIFTIQNFLDIDRQWLMSYLPGKIVNIMQYGKDKHTRSMFIFKSDPISYDRTDVAQQKAILSSVFQDENYWVIPQILEALRDADDLYFDEVTQIHMDQLSKGRVALLGDAAAATTLFGGQGTSSAVVGAYVLAGELKAARGDFKTAFKCYEDTFLDYARKNQALAVMSNHEFAIPTTWDEVNKMNDELRSLSGIQEEEQPESTSAGALIQAAANAIDLKDYTKD